MRMCGKCIHKEKVFTDYPCDGCNGVTYYEEPKPITNADRIRAMSDEELADFLYETETQYIPIDLSVENNWLDWLKQEAK